MFWKRKPEPFVNYLPEPSDALINLLRGIIKDGGDLAKFKVGLSSLEAPSARLAIQLYQIEKYGQADLVVEVAAIQQPDARIPHKPVDFVLWEYKGTEPQTSLHLPSSHVSETISQLAQMPYLPQKWADQGSKFAKDLGVDKANELLAVMVHPPARLSQFPIWEWLPRVQVASAYVIARLDSGWDNSIRHRYLFSLARGPMDWSVEAALLPLAYIAKTEPSVRNSIAELYFELLHGMPRPGGIPYRDALLWSISEIIESIPDSTLQIKLSKRFIAELKTYGR
jgi:hypothetical protein